MIFSQAKTVVERMTQQAFLSANTVRKEEARKLLDFYHGRQLPHVDARLAQRAPTISQEMETIAVNITAKVTNAIAQAYRNPPMRELEAATAGDKTLFADIAEACALDARMKQASRYCKLLGTVFLRPVWRNNRLDLDVLTPDLVDVEAGDSPEDLQAVLVTHYGTGTRVEDVTFSLWTPDLFRRLDHRGQVLEEQPNPYGALPFVPCWAGMPDGDFWYPVNDTLGSVQEAINQRLADFLRVMEMQAFSVAVGKGLSAGDLTIGPGNVVELQEDGDFHFENQNAPILDHLEAIDRLVKWAAMSHGLSAAYVSLDPSDASGVAKAIDSQELAEARQDEVMLWRVYEKRIFEVMRAVWNVHNPGRGFSEAAWLRVDFADPRPELSPQEQALLWEKWQALGIVSEVDLAMEHNKDLTTRKEAEAHLLELAQERARLRDPSLDDLMLLHKAGAIPLDVFLRMLQERGWLPLSVDVAGIVAAKEAKVAEVQAAMAGMDQGAQELEEEDAETAGGAA